MRDWRLLMALRVVVWALIAAGCVSFFLVGADGAARPYLTNSYLPGWPHSGPAGVSHP